MQIKSVEFQPPVKGPSAKPFSGWVCVACTEYGYWVSGCDTNSPEDAYSVVEELAADKSTGDSILPHTVQMFQVGEK